MPDIGSGGWRRCNGGSDRGRQSSPRRHLRALIAACPSRSCRTSSEQCGSARGPRMGSRACTRRDRAPNRVRCRRPPATRRVRSSASSGSGRRASSFHSTPTCQGRLKPFICGVKLCITSRQILAAVGRHAVELAVDLVVIRPEAGTRPWASTCSLVRPLLAGTTTVPSLISGVEPSPPGQRLQSITSRE